MITNFEDPLNFLSIRSSTSSNNFPFLFQITIHKQSTCTISCGALGMVTVKGGRTRWPATVVVVVVENETNRRGNDIGEATSSVLVLATVIVQWWQEWRLGGGREGVGINGASWQEAVNFHGCRWPGRYDLVAMVQLLMTMALEVMEQVV